MKKLKIGKDSRQVYDLEHVTRPIIFIKGIGKYCKCGCGRHVIGNIRKQFFTKNCWYRWKNKTMGISRRTALTCTLAIKQTSGKRKLVVYPKKAAKFEFYITPDQKELWSFMNKIESSRNNI